MIIARQKKGCAWMQAETHNGIEPHLLVLVCERDKTEKAIALMEDKRCFFDLLTSLDETIRTEHQQFLF